MPRSLLPRPDSAVYTAKHFHAVLSAKDRYFRSIFKEMGPSGSVEISQEDAKILGASARTSCAFVKGVHLYLVPGDRPCVEADLFSFVMSLIRRWVNHIRQRVYHRRETEFLQLSPSDASVVKKFHLYSLFADMEMRCVLAPGGLRLVSERPRADCYELWRLNTIKEDDETLTADEE